MPNFNVDEDLSGLVKQCEDINFPKITSGHLWDFRKIDPEVSLRNISSQGVESNNFPTPRPCQELERAKGIQNIRTSFRDNVSKHLGIEPPKECINRWLFNQLAVPKNIKQPNEESSTSDTNTQASMLEPLLRCPKVAGDSKVLHTQLLESLPSSLVIPWGKKKDVKTLKKSFQDYIDGALNWTSGWRSNADAVSNEEMNNLLDIEKNLHKLMDSIENSRSAHEILNVHGAKVQEICHQKYFTDRFSVIIDDIVKNLIEQAEKMVQDILNIEEPEGDNDTVVMIKKDVSREFRYNGDSVNISTLHYIKLKQLYRIHNSIDTEKYTEKQKIDFHRTLYVLARRYATFFGEGEGAAFHAAAPESSFEVMRDDLGVCQELFASPFNCHFAKFCSAFPDIDCWFGSCGSFFDFVPVSGSYEVGPPYTIEVMDQMAAKLEILLENSGDDPLSFIVFVPDWRNPNAGYHEIMDNSKFRVADHLMKGNDHAYVVGDQHTSEKRYFSLPFATRVYILQNSAGSEKWKVGDDFMDKLTKSLRRPITFSEPLLGKRKQNYRDYSRSKHHKSNHKDYRNDRGYSRRDDRYDRDYRDYNDRSRYEDRGQREYNRNDRRNDRRYDDRDNRGDRGYGGYRY